MSLMAINCHSRAVRQIVVEQFETFVDYTNKVRVDVHTISCIILLIRFGYNGLTMIRNCYGCLKEGYS